MGVALLGSGCVTFGGREGLPSHVESISIPMFRNHSMEYGAEEVVTQAVVGEFQRDGRLRLVDSDQADVVLYGTIARYDIRPSSFDRRDRVTVSHVSAMLEVSVLDSESGDYLMQGERFSGSGSFFLTAQPTARRERDVLTRIANDIVSRVVEGW